MLAVTGIQRLQADDVVVADSAMFAIEGRYQINSDDHSVTMGYPGVTLHVRFEGTGLLMSVEAFNDEMYLDVRVDDGEYDWIALEKGAQQLQIAEVEQGIHTVEIIRRNETWQGLLKVNSLAVQNGNILDAPELPEKRLMFIGDSITCGDSCDIREEGPHTRGFEHNGRLSYGYQISRLLGTQCHLVSYGGRGVIRDWQGNRATNNAPQFYERTLADDETSRWEHVNYIPDAIGICLGTNDFSRGIPDQNEFVNACVEFVRKIMRDAPNAKVFLIDSPMFGTDGSDGVKRSALNLYLDQVIEFIGDERVCHLKLGHFPGRPENAHPVASEQAEISRILAPAFVSAIQ